LPHDAAKQATAVPPAKSYEKALTFAAMGFHEQAVKALRDVTAREPGHAPAWKKLAELLRREGKDEEASIAASRAASHEAAWPAATDPRSAAEIDTVESALRARMAEAAVQAGVARFGGIDCLVNNASAISLTGALETPMKRFDLMMSVNLRGTYLCSQACLPHLLGAPNPHILTLSPPLNFDPRWFRGHPAYTISKYAMSLCVLGLAAEFADRGVAVNGLWPKTVIATAALNVIPGMDPRRARRPEIVADAAWQILVGDAKSCTGNLFTDEEVLAAAGETDFDRYNMDPAQRPFPDLFVD